MPWRDLAATRPPRTTANRRPRKFVQRQRQRHIMHWPAIGAPAETLFGILDGTMKSRPPFMITLGLLPPVTEEDAKRAYLAKVKLAHPDHGGSREDFDAVQDAYRHALEYVRLWGDRRTWIRERMDRYLQLEDVTAKLDQLGAQVETDVVDWINQLFGDFAMLASEVTGVRLVNSALGDQLIQHLVDAKECLGGLRRLALPGCQVSDDAVLRLSELNCLTHIDLSRAPISSRALGVVRQLPLLQSLELEGSSIGWWARRGVQRELARQARDLSKRNALSSLSGI